MLTEQEIRLSAMANALRVAQSAAKTVAQKYKDMAARELQDVNHALHRATWEAVEAGVRPVDMVNATGIGRSTIYKYREEYHQFLVTTRGEDYLEQMNQEKLVAAGDAITYSVETEGNIKVIYAQRGDEAVRIDTDKTYYSPEGPLGRAMAAKCPEWLTLEEHYRAQKETGLKIDGLSDDNEGEW